MRKKFYLVLAIYIISILCGCKNPTAESSSDTLTPLDYNVENTVELCLYNDCMIFYQESSSSIIFYKYNLKNDMTYLLGTIEKLSYQQFDNFAINENKLYLYLPTQTYLEGMDEEHLQALYQIDLEHNTIEKLAEDRVTRGYLSLYALDKKVFTLKEQLDSNKCHTYLDIYDTVQGANSDFQVFLSKEYDKNTGTGEEILDFCIDDEIIYLFVKESNNDKITWKIEKYDMLGQAEREVQLPNHIDMNVQSWTRNLRFEVIGNYVYLKNLNGNRLVFNISSGKAEIELQNKHLILEVSSDIENRKFAIIYTEENGKIWEINKNSDTISEKSFPNNYDFIGGMWSEGENKLVVFLDQAFYKNFA